MKHLLAITLIVLSFSAHAKGPIKTTTVQLNEAVKTMKMPRLEARLKARAAAYRIFHKTVMQLGFGHDLVQQPTLNGKKFAAVKSAKH